MKVVIFCGGKGYRIREETEFRPKPMVEIGGKPMLWHIMNIYSHYGYSDFVLCLGYKGNMIRRYFLHYLAMNNDVVVDLKSEGIISFPRLKDRPPWRITLVDTGLEAMTGARLKRVQKYIDTDLFMLTYGDGLADVNIRNLVNFHKRSKKIGTITGVHPSPRFGELIYERNQVKKFSEKPYSKKSLINGGFFVFDRRIFKYVNNRDGCTFEKEPLENLARDGQLGYYSHPRFWHCMDTFRDMRYLNQLCKQKKAPWIIW